MKIKFNMTQIDDGSEYVNDGTEDDSYYDRPLNNKEIVLPPNQEYILKIDYPLSAPAKFKVKSGEKGITRGKLVSLVRKYYQKVYEIEDSSTGVKPGKAFPLLNRNFTDGKFGIWGHVIGDLVLVDAEVSKKNVISLGVDS
jgi:hypothetical protein